MKAFMFIVGVALTVASLAQYADARERQHRTKSQSVIVGQPSHRSDAFAAWPAPYPEPYGYGYYSGGYSAPAGR